MGGRDEECVELYKEGESLSPPKKVKRLLQEPEN